MNSEESAEGGKKPAEKNLHEKFAADELQFLKDADSSMFGFVKLNKPENSKKKASLVKAIKGLEKVLANHFRRKQRDSKEDSASDTQADEVSTFDQGSSLHAKVYLKLGHFNLLLEEYAKALSAYQVYFKVCEEHWKNIPFMYGLGLVYFHYNEFRWAIKAFRHVLYLNPSFIRANEIHLRLGVTFKVLQDYELSKKHFQLVLADSTHSSFSKSEVLFHMAHLLQVQGKYKLAKEAYEQLLEHTDLSPSLRAEASKELGWMHHTAEVLGEKPQRQVAALHYLQKSIEADPTNGQSLYFLGRCYASTGKVHDAFVSYRSSVDKLEANSDTWCSIGVLYQQQNQPMDALQAYICAVQLDKTHTAAWTNLGILYENCNMPKDALKCYVNANNGKGPMNPNLATRVKVLQNQSSTTPAANNQRQPKLPCIEDAWNFPISQEMASRQNAAAHGQINRANLNNQRQTIAIQGGGGQAPVVQPVNQSQAPGIRPSSLINLPQDQPPNKRIKLASNPQQAVPPDVKVQPSFYLNQQQLQLLSFFQQNQASLTPQQRSLFQQLQQQYHHMQQHQQQQKLLLQNQLPVSVSTTNATPTTPTPSTTQVSVNATTAISTHPFLVAVEGKDKPNPPPPSPQPPNPVKTEKPVHPQVKQEASNTSQPSTTLQDICSAISEKDLQILLSHKDIPASTTDDIMTTEDRLKRRKSTEDNWKMAPLANNHKDNGEPKERDGPVPCPVALSINMSSSQLLEACKQMSGVTNTSIMSELCPPPVPPDPPYPPLPQDRLLPSTPSVYVDNKKDAFSPQMEKFCLSHPIAVIRGLTNVLKLDLGLFSTKSLVEANPDHSIEVRTQLMQSSEENWDADKRKQVWRCESHRSHTSVARYAQYQASSFQKSLKDEQDKMSTHANRDSDSDSNSPSRNKKVGRKNTLFKTIKFGTNVDLSDDRKWRQQLQELAKLPAFLRVVSAGNMLSHVGHVILGMNTVQLYMKVPGSRTPGHQENNNMSSVNINIGPGDTEWFAVDDQYWGAIHRLCEKHNINFLHGSWWPLLEDLSDENIPVYRFLQKPGDIVFVNAGTVHWVQAVGWCNNIAWNVGPLTPKQYKLAVERYEWNKLQNYKSIVPMAHLTWNLARNLKLSDQALFEQIKYCLLRTLRMCQMILDFLKDLKKEVSFHGRAKNEASHYCTNCDVEVFNILFVKEVDKKHMVHCLDCARKCSITLEGFIMLEEYTMGDLMEVYDKFILHPVPPSSIAN